MFHELLMVLNGYPGSIFIATEDVIKVSNDIPNLHPAERSILERLCALASKYKYLNDFAKNHRIHYLEGEYEVDGLYVEAFCHGLDAVLNIYRQELVKLEEEVIKDPFISLSYFLKLEEFELQFKVLCDAVFEILNNKVHGCRILELVYNHSISGVPMVEMSMNKILKHCHKVLYRHMFSWIVYGFVEDPYEEFFIQPETLNSKASLQKTLPVADTSADSENKNYEIKPELLPSYIPSSVASKILFVGQYVNILGKAKDQEASIMFINRERNFAQKILQLSEQPVFSLLQFEAAIEAIRKCTTEHLWQEIVKEANLSHHLTVMKDFFLLGRGELFVNFISDANKLLKMPVTTNTEKEANRIFQNAARITFPDSDTPAEKFCVVFDTDKNSGGEVNKESLSKAKLESGWTAISLTYDVPQPLNFLISTDVIDRYNIIFKFLLAVRKVQIELHQCWAMQMSFKGAGRNYLLVPFWNLRLHMSFLIDNFQYYVLVDVLESRFKHLLDKVSTVRDFEAIQQYHDHFLTSVKSQCFLELKPVRNFLLEILDICSTFCALMSKVSLPFSQRDIVQFENIKSNFQKQTSYLFRVLSGVHTHQVSPHLAQLLLRIDYNKYLSSSDGQFCGMNLITKIK